MWISVLEKALFWCTNVTQEHRKYIDKNIKIKNKEERKKSMRNRDRAGWRV